MTLPIIIVLERHWDVVNKATLASMLNILGPLGYNALGLEFSSDITAKEQIDAIKGHVVFIKEQLTAAKKLLELRNIHLSDVQLTQMNYSDLERLLLAYVSSRHSKEMAQWFRELPAFESQLSIFEHLKAFGVELYGLDLPKAQMQEMDATITNITKRVTLLDKLDDERIQSFTDHLLSYQNRGKNMIFSVGQSHYQKLVESFAGQGLLTDVLFVQPYCAQQLDTSMDDQALPDLETTYPHLQIIRKKIVDEKDAQLLLGLLKEKIEDKVEGYKTIAPTQACRFLKRATGLSFRAVQRPSRSVDGYSLEEKNNLDEKIKGLKNQGIAAYHTLFQGKQVICVANMNDALVAEAIMKL